MGFVKGSWEGMKKIEIKVIGYIFLFFKKISFKLKIVFKLYKFVF